jgi:hypothetical protein
LRDDLQAEIDRRILEGYRRVPQTAEEDAWAGANARAAVREDAAFDEVAASLPDLLGAKLTAYLYASTRSGTRAISRSGSAPA